MKKGVLRNFTKFTGKHLCQSLIFDKVAGLRPFLIKLQAWGLFHRKSLMAASVYLRIHMTQCPHIFTSFCPFWHFNPCKPCPNHLKFSERLLSLELHKQCKNHDYWTITAQKMKFTLRISSVNVTKSAVSCAVSCGFGYICCRNL